MSQIFSEVPQEKPAEQQQKSQNWRLIMLGGLVNELSSPQVEPVILAAYCNQLRKQGQDWKALLLASAEFSQVNLPPEVLAEVERLVLQAESLQLENQSPPS